ncbi:hypothetical protein [Streptomyces sp. NPDC051098]|uniref:hypothetical protein n=1 Tax=Streptomyces sp. NPDC051098 TaxID=3155411 RepID=UPI0034262B9F
MTTPEDQPRSPWPPPIVVHPVMPGDPPFRSVEINGELAGIARDLVELLDLAYSAGLKHIDLDDPAQVRWVGGGKYKWVP